MLDYTNTFVGTQKVYDEGLRSYLLKVYNYMALALALSAVSGFMGLYFEPLKNLLFQTQDGHIMGTSGLGMVVMFAPVLIAFYFFWGIGTMSFDTSRVLFWVYASLTGMSLASLGLIYTGESLARSFFVSAAAFGATSIYGYTTKRDLTSVGSFLFMGLIGIMVASVVNIFLRSSAIHFATSILGIVIFIGLTAWDTQKIKGMYYSTGGGEEGQKMGIVAAFTLYLDFINLFLYILRFFGQRRSD